MVGFAVDIGLPEPFCTAYGLHGASMNCMSITFICLKWCFAEWGQARIRRRKAAWFSWFFM